MAIADTRKRLLLVFITLIAAACYALIGYIIPRSSFMILMLLVSGAFFSYVLMVSQFVSKNYFKILIALSFLFRIIFLFSIPLLSDDYFRFVWDGSLSAKGVNPYAYTPDALQQLQGNLAPFYVQLKAGMNSAPYYSVYPPLLQCIFFIGAKAGGTDLLNNIIGLRICSLAAEAGTIYLIIKLLDHFRMPQSRVLLYALNPLVIIEFSGNLHGEVYMILLLSLAFFFLVKEQLLWSAVALGLAISAKLLPFIFLPAMISFFGTKKGLIYSFLVLITATATFLPFADQTFIVHITRSLGLYFDKFEFNASIYYLLRTFGYHYTGFNLIYIIGKALPLCSVMIILWIAFKRQALTTLMLIDNLVLTVLAYYLLCLVVHPWYITVLVFLSVFSNYRFTFFWSALVMLSYATYMQHPYKELLWVTALEYIIVGGLIVTEFRKSKKGYYV